MVSVGLAIFLAIASEMRKRLTAPKVPQKASGVGVPNLRDVHNTSTTMPFHVLICTDGVHYFGVLFKTSDEIKQASFAAEVGCS